MRHELCHSKHLNTQRSWWRILGNSRKVISTFAGTRLAETLYTSQKVFFPSLIQLLLFMSKKNLLSWNFRQLVRHRCWWWCFAFAPNFDGIAKFFALQFLFCVKFHVLLRYKWMTVSESFDISLKNWAIGAYLPHLMLNLIGLMLISMSTSLCLVKNISSRVAKV